MNVTQIPVAAPFVLQLIGALVTNVSELDPVQRWFFCL